MAIKVINIGSSANKGDGDPLRTAFTKINENFAALDPTGTNTITDITGSVFADDSALMVDGVNGKIVGPIESTSILPGNGLTDIGSTGNRFYNAWFTGQVETDSVLANIFYGPLTGNVTGDVSGTAGAVAFSGITGKPTTVAGYGITDALSGAVTGSNTGTVNFTGATLNFVSTTFNGLNFDDLGTTPTTIAGYGITDATSNNNPTFTGAVDFTSSTSIDFNTTTINNLDFADLSNTPTTIAGYGITDALALGTSASTALAGNTALFDGDYGSLSNTPTLFDGVFASLTSKPTTISGYGITDALSLGTSSTTALAGDTALFDGVFASLTSKPTTVAGYGITDNTWANLGDKDTATGPQKIALGKKAGETSQGDFAVAIGNLAAETSQGLGAVAVGYYAGKTTQGTSAVAVGDQAGETLQGTSAIAIGDTAGNIEQSIECIAIGKNAGAGAEETATYVSGGVSGDPITMVVDDTTGIIPGMRITGTGFTYTLLEQQQKVLSVDNATTITIDAIANNGTPSGTLTFKSAQEFYSIAIGSSAGLTSQNAGAVALGYQAGMTAQMGAVAVGSRAGEVTQGNGGVAVGVDSGRTNQGLHGIAIGKFAGNSNQSQKGIAIGYQTGETSQGEYSIAIGERAGETNQHANTIILNASTSPLNSVQTDQFIVKPVRSSAGTTHLQYNSSTGEITHLDTITATIVATTATPPTANADAGDTGEIRYDDNYLYIKTASGWKRTALSGIV